MNKLALNEFREQQKILKNRIEQGDAKYVFIDPDGTWHDWVVVVVEHQTGIIYGTQCCGTSCDERYIEGFLIPCNGALFNAEDGSVSSVILTTPFHESKNSCDYRGAGNFPKEKIEELARLVAQIPFWHNTDSQNCTRDSLEIDMARVHEICEAWVPVKTVFGRGVLLWENCD